jgi:hypothetical protein
MKIVLRESGGLGNQLFQYAALRYYAKRYRAEMHIAVDPSWNAFCNGYPRPCLLQHFSIPVPMKERTFFHRIAAPVKPWLHDASAPFRKVLGIQVFNEQEADRYCFKRNLPLEPRVKTLYLWGYFQNHAMVEEVAGELRLELTFREPPRGKTLDVLQQIERSKTPVSLHVRRGDSTLPVEGKVVLTKEYYANAIALIKERFDDPSFFVFSDDIPFVKQNLGLDPGSVFVDHNGTFAAHEDLRLMSSCQHHIIANSTFSWWGAWLNPRTNKVVIAPRRWFLDIDNYHPNLFSRDWMLAEVETAENHFA